MGIVVSVNPLDTLSRLKGIETTGVCRDAGHCHRALDTLSRLKGIETKVSFLSRKAMQTLDTLSHLKGIG